MCGDLDSFQKLEPQDEGTIKVLELQDQDRNDFDKTLELVLNSLNLSESNLLLVNGTIGSRFDHTMLNMNLFLKYSLMAPERTNIVSVNKDSFQVIIPQGIQLELTLPDNISTGTGIGLIPLFGKVSNLKTKGLLWDLDGFLELQFGEFISTSNGIADWNHEKVLSIQNDGASFLLTLDRSHD